MYVPNMWSSAVTYIMFCNAHCLSADFICALMLKECMHDRILCKL